MAMASQHPPSPQVDKPVNVASVPFRSPFRYPGGKTWFVPRLRRWLGNLPHKPKLLVEPFTGGGIVGLTAGFEDLVEHVLLVELDPQIAAVWHTILAGEGDALADKILAFDLSTETVEAELNQTPSSVLEQAFQTILKNRVNRGGILAQGAGRVKTGENGKGLASRWYPETLAKRIRDIIHIRHKFTFVQGDALEQLAQHQADPTAVFFVDPPYTAGGKSAGSRLYNFPDLDHDQLFAMCTSLQGDFLMTYDNEPAVKQLAQKYGLATQEIAMKNSHHAKMTELLIGRDLSWNQ